MKISNYIACFSLVVFSTLVLSAQATHAASVTLTDSAPQTVDGENYIFHFDVLDGVAPSDGTLGTFTIHVRGDYSQIIMDATEFLTWDIDGMISQAAAPTLPGFTGSFTQISGNDVEWTESYSIPAATMVMIAADSDIDISVDLENTVHAGLSANPFVEVAFNYAAVPEPTTLALAALGLLGIGCCRRKRAVGSWLAMLFSVFPFMRAFPMRVPLTNASVVVVLSINLLGLATQEAAANDFGFVLRETISVPAGAGNSLVALTDMDGDGELDVVLGFGASDNFTILEQNGAMFIERYTFSESPLRAVAVGDVDGDGRPEVLSASKTSITIHEASGDNVYQIVHQASGYGPFIEGVVHVGDSNDNGKLEFLIPQESFPSRVHILEGTANNTYTNLGSVTGPGGNNFFAGVRDLDGDGSSEIVFGDDQYSNNKRQTYVYENGSLVYENNALNLNPEFLGDTDGNGLQEILGRHVDGNLIILESCGDNTFCEVFNQPTPFGRLQQNPFVPFVQDVNNDGREELLRVHDGGGGFQDIVSIMTRSGTSLNEIWDSGSLFQAFGGDIQSVLAVSDTNGNGIPELAVLQTGQLHILEFIPEPSSLTFAGLGLIGLLSYGSRRGKRARE